MFFKLSFDFRLRKGYIVFIICPFVLGCLEYAPDSSLNYHKGNLRLHVFVVKKIASDFELLVFSFQLMQYFEYVSRALFKRLNNSTLPHNGPGR